MKISLHPTDPRMSSFKANLVKMFSELNHAQQEYFKFDFPKIIETWYDGGFWGDQPSENPELDESYSSTSGTQYLKVKGKMQFVRDDLDKLVYALWCVRKCYGRIMMPPALYRISIFSNPKKLTKAQLTVKDQQKPLTSWSANPEVRVINRMAKSKDHLLTWRNPQAKHVLASSDMLMQFAVTVEDNPKDFGMDSTEKFLTTKQIQDRNNLKYVWHILRKTVQAYSNEEEYMVYLGPGQSIDVEIKKKGKK